MYNIIINTNTKLVKKLILINLIQNKKNIYNFKTELFARQNWKNTWSAYYIWEWT